MNSCELLFTWACMQRWRILLLQKCPNVSTVNFGGCLPPRPQHPRRRSLVSPLSLQGISSALLEWKGIEATERLANSHNAKVGGRDPGGLQWS